MLVLGGASDVQGYALAPRWLRPFGLTFAAFLVADAGHTAAMGPFFGIDPQARLDYGYQAVGSLTPMAKQLIKTVYGKDGNMTKEPKGFGGQLCHTAPAPYERRQGNLKKTATAEANEPDYLEVEAEQPAGCQWE